MIKFPKLTGAIAAFIACVPSLQAYDFTSEGFFFNILDDSVAKDEDIWVPTDGSYEWHNPKCVEITYNPKKYAQLQGSYSGDIQIPLKVTYNGEDYYIVNIGDEAFRYCVALNSVTFPMATEYTSEGGFLRYIKSYAFADSGIKSVSGSTEYIKEVGESAFTNSKIESFTCYTCTYLGPNIFSSSAIKEFKLIDNSGDGNNEFNIPPSAFRDCTNLKSIPSASTISIESIGSNAFEGCVQLTDGIEAKYIGTCAFKWCTSLSSYRFYTTKYVGERAFENCTALYNVDFCGWSSSGLPLEFASGLHVFDGCTRLKDVIINRQFIVDYDTMEECNPFDGCPIEKITFKDFGLSFNMTGQSFPQLKEIKCATLIPPLIGTLTTAQYRDIKVTVPKQVYTEYTTSPDWKNFTSLTAYEDDQLAGIIEINGVYYHYGNVVRNPFKRYEGRIELVNQYTLNDRTYSVNTISEEAFYNCRDLTEVVFPAICTINSFGSCAFARSGIKEIDLSYLDKIDYGDNSYSSIWMQDHIFWDCENLVKATLPNCLKEIPKGCFDECKNLLNINWPDNLESIDDWAFSECGSLGNGSINLSNQTMDSFRIGRGAFEKCNLSDVAFPNVETTICQDAFSDNKLSKINIPDGSHIEGRAFANNHLSEVSLGKHTSAGEMIACGNDNVAVLRANSISIDYSELFDDQTNWFSTGHVDKVIIEGYNDALAWNWKTWNVNIIENHQTKPATLDEFTDEQYENVLVYVPFESYEDYRTAPIWNKFKNLKGIDFSSVNSIYGNPKTIVKGGYNQVMITNVPMDTTIDIYSIDGKHVASAKADYGLTIITLPTGIYLVAVEESSPVKVAVQ